MGGRQGLWMRYSRRWSIPYSRRDDMIRWRPAGRIKWQLSQRNNGLRRTLREEKEEERVRKGAWLDDSVRYRPV